MSDGPKLLGSAEILRGYCWVRLSRKADPTRKRIRLDDPSITKEQGERIAHQLSIDAIAKGFARQAPRVADSAGLSVEDWCEIWHTDRVARKVVTTDRHDRGRLKEHVLSFIGERGMAHVTATEIEEVVLSLDAKVVAGELSWKTAATVWGLISKMFDDAWRSKNKKLRVRDDDPTVGVLPPERGEDKAKAFLYPSEFTQLLTSPVLIEGKGLDKKYAANVAQNSRRWLRVFVLATYLEVRAGELRSLRLTDIDFAHWICHVHRATERDSGGKREKSTKGGTTRRFVIEPALRPLLLAIKAEGGGKRGRLIDLPHEGDLSERLRRYLRWVGVTREDLHIENDPHRCPITFHDLRATGITWRALRGDNPLAIQRAAGHQDLATTQIYIRIAEDLGKAAGEPFPELPASLLGSFVPSEQDRAAMGLTHVWPTLDPQIGEVVDIMEENSVPSGIRTPNGRKTRRETGHRGSIDPQDGLECPPSEPPHGSSTDAVKSSLWRSLLAAIEDGEQTAAAQLAGKLAAISAEENAANVVPFPARGLRGSR